MTARAVATQTAILDALPSHIALIDAQGIVTSVNRAWRRFAGANGILSADAGIGLDYLGICDRAHGVPDAHEVAAGIRAVLEGREKIFTCEYPCHSPAEERWFELTVTPLSEDPPNGAVLVHSNITERKLAEEAQREYRLLFEGNPHPMWVFDAETLAFLAVNDAAVRLYGFSKAEFMGMTIKDIRPAHEVPELLEYISTMPDSFSLPATQVRHHKKDGSLLEVEGLSNPIEFGGRRARLVMANDVSPRRLLEAQLLQSQKMEAVGRLAGGVAHDFNNSLGVILGYTELLLRQSNDSQRGRLEEILKAVHRSSALTRQLLAFSRKQVVDPRVLDLNVLLSDVEQMLRRLIGEDVEVVIARGADLGRVTADASQLEQVVLNLCVNARDAMPDGGSLRLETRNAEIGADEGAKRDGMAPGRYVVLEVTDSGCGIPGEILRNIFDPFFTTKGAGKGTGLGLAMVYGIVTQAGGYVSVDSEVGRGTTFRIDLPRIDDLVAPAAEEIPLPAKGTETILLVEDEDSLRAMTREILEENGYRILDAAGPEEALEIFRRQPEAIDLLITDVVMPVMNGRKLATLLAAMRPGLRVLFVSGYTNDAIAHSGVLDADTLLLEKPFTAAALLGRVREALANGGPHPTPEA